jgi:hypothetical protein
MNFVKIVLTHHSMNSRRFSIALLALVSFASTASADPYFIDTFNGSSLNPANWVATAPFSDSSVVVSNGNLILNNGGRVLTAGDFSGALDMTMVFSFTGNPHDSFHIALRTDGVVTGNRNLFNDGVYVSFRYESDPSDPAGFADNVTLVAGNVASTTLF